MRTLPPFTGDRELDAWNQEVAEYLRTLPAQPLYNQGTGIITNPTDSSVIGYLYRYMHIKYADSPQGDGFSDTRTDKAYYGLYNSEEVDESADYSKYTWFEVDGGFSTDKILFYKIQGGRAVDFNVGTVPLDSRWSPVPSLSIDLDDLIASESITEDDIAPGAITTLKLADGSVTHPKLATDAVHEINILDDSVSLQKLQTSGVPTADKVLNGEMTWIELPQSGLFLAQQELLINSYVEVTWAGGHVYHPLGHAFDRVISIQNEALLDFPIGTTLTVVNLENIVTVRIDAGDLILIGAGTITQAVEVAAFGRANLIKVASGLWTIDGTNLTSTTDPGAGIGEGDFNFLGIMEGEGVDFDF